MSNGSRHSRLVALLWASIATFILGQGLNLAWHRGHSLERGAGPFHNPGAVLASLGFLVIVRAAIVMTRVLRTEGVRPDRDQFSRRLE